MFGLGCALTGAAVALSGPSDAAALAAEAAGAAADAPSGVVVSTTVLGEREVVICLVDPARQRLAVYLADGRRSRLKLLAVRDISADWMLADYNNDPPLPKEIRARAEKGLETAAPAAVREPAPAP